MRKIINECYAKTKKILTENKDLLKLLADTLLENETITKEQIDHLVEFGTLPEETEEPKEQTTKDEKKEKTKKDAE